MRIRQAASEWTEGMRIAIEQLRAHKVRSMLTALGVIIGIISVTLMGTAIKGIDKGFDDSMDMIGKDMIYIERWPWDDPGDNWRMYRNRPHIEMKDAQAINDWVARKPDSLIRIAVGNSGTMRSIEHGDKKAPAVYISGTTYDFTIVNTADILEGRFFTYGEQQGRRNVVVLGYDVADALFNKFPERAVGETVKLAGMRFTVIGVLDRQGSFLGLQSWDNQAIISLPALRKFYPGNRHNSIRVQAVAGAPMDQVEDELMGVYRRIRGLLPEERNDFELNRSQALESQLGPIKSGIALAGFFITGLALFVGAIGIMNITFVSVKERTKEIGTRRAVGARQSAIIIQFLIEAVAVCLIGGITGLVAAFALNKGLSQAFPAFPFTFSTDLVMLAVTLSVLTGVFSGLAPAIQASKLNPVSALRHE